MKNLQKILLSITIAFLLINHIGFAQDDIVEEFKEKNGEEWSVGTHPWGLLNLATRPRPQEIGPNITDGQAAGIAESFILENENFFGVETLTFSDAGLEGTGLYRSWVINFVGDVYEGLPITRIQLTALVTRDGQVFGVGDVEVSTIIFQEMLEGYYMMSSITEEEAVDSAREGTQSSGQTGESSLTYAPSSETGDFDYLLAWDVSFDDKRVLVDARDGSILSVKSIETKTPKEEIMEFLEGSMNLTTGIIIILIVLIVAIILIIFFRSRQRKSSTVHELRMSSK